MEKVADAGRKSDARTVYKQLERLNESLKKGRSPGRSSAAPAAPAAPAQGQVRALLTTRGSSVPRTSTAVLPGMSPDVVRGMLGAPNSVTEASGDLRWAYDDCTIVFTNGRVSNVVFE